MDFRTIVKIEKPDFAIEPFERMLFVGSCFAENLGRRFLENCFRATVNPYGVMYNPASIWHTVERVGEESRVVVLTLGTNHVYVERATGTIVDNCEKRPQKEFDEQVLSVDECVDYLSRTIDLLLSRNAETKVIVTVSPIRYAKYGYHGSQLSKAVLLLAADGLTSKYPETVVYFPAYEIVNDELRDYRFYTSDMLHPSEQAVGYIWERFSELYFSAAALRFMDEWRPVKEALAHRPFHPESEEYRRFMEKTQEKMALLKERYPALKDISLRANNK